MIELGVPFSDPCADGPVIQKAGDKALGFGIGLPQVLDMVRDFRQTRPINARRADGLCQPGRALRPAACHRLASKAPFIRDAAEAGVDGMLVVDYPPEECEDFAAELKANGMDLIFLLAPTSHR